MVVSTANGSRESGVEVTVNEASLVSDARLALGQARVLGLVAEGRSAALTADVLEKSGGYEVAIARQSTKLEELTSSERRSALRRSCELPRVDASILVRASKTESSGVWRAMLVGRVVQNVEWVGEILVCKTNSSSSFSGTLRVDSGMMNVKSNSEYEELVAKEFGQKLLSAFGRTSTGQPSESTNTVAARSEQTSQQTAPSEKERITAMAPDSSSAVNTIADAQRTLNALGYQAGAPDGVLGRRTTDALRAFQRDQKLTISGRLDDATKDTS
jgi:hypothetical protein